MPSKDKRFGFGKNWNQYATKHLNQEKINISKQHLLTFLDRDNLNGLTFLDIGCGSGIHSLAAQEAGANTIHSLDYDKFSVITTRYVQSEFGKINNWTIEQGSVLDDAYMNSLAQYDIVYSWGVLHHTGDVWHAIKNAASRVKPGGLFFIALYSADIVIPSPEFWLDIKQKYIAANWLQKHYYHMWYIWKFMMYKNPMNFFSFLKRVLEYKKNRGMNLYTDIKDWLGGWPMEFVADKEAVSFCEKLGFTLKEMTTGEANTEFLFIKT